LFLKELKNITMKITIATTDIKDPIEAKWFQETKA